MVLIGIALVLLVLFAIGLFSLLIYALPLGIILMVSVGFFYRIAYPTAKAWWEINKENNQKRNG